MSNINAEVEQAWLNQLNAECNAVYQECSLPGDRPATPAETRAFLASLKRLETYCLSVQTTAAQLDAVGYHALSQRLVVVLTDIRGARAAFAQPAPAQPGPATQNALAIQQEQREVSEFSTSAMQMIAADPAGAEPLVLTALERTANMFSAQRTFLLGMDAWGAEQLPRLEHDRMEAIMTLHMGLGHAATMLGKYEQARNCYRRALAELGETPHRARPNIQQAIAQIALLEAGRARF